MVDERFECVHDSFFFCVLIFFRFLDAIDTGWDFCLGYCFFLLLCFVSQYMYRVLCRRFRFILGCIDWAPLFPDAILFSFTPIEGVKGENVEKV